MKQNSSATGHLLALFTILVWGTTFIVTKLLLRSLSPVAIMLYRFLIGYIMLWILYPHPLKITSPKEELYFLLAGASGVTLYFACENYALSYTYASNVSIVVATAPFLTGLFAHFLYKEKIRKSFLLGFITSIIGIIIITTNGSAILHLNPLGDFLALCAALCWAVYSLTTAKLNKKGYSTFAVTRRIFFYGILTMLPLTVFGDYHFDTAIFHSPITLLQLGYLGLIASGLCYVTWNKALHILGAVKTSVYIYLNPLVAILFSFLILKEQLTPLSVLGCLLVLCGLFLSEKK